MSRQDFTVGDLRGERGDLFTRVRADSSGRSYHKVEVARRVVVGSVMCSQVESPSVSTWATFAANRTE